ncbi:MAG: hypothetical protein PHU46_06360 [Rhodocyclaceae bacterium]|nr:hypothetical protein [Rhodocyclaceae bacterium]
MFARFSKWLPITAILGVPGTMLHELAHWSVGLLTLARPRSITLWPRREGGRFVLGEAGFSFLGFWNGAFVALAPLLLAPLAGLAFLTAMGAWVRADFVMWTVFGYLAAVLLRASIPSSADMRVAIPSLIFYAVLGAGLAYQYREWQTSFG